MVYKTKFLKQPIIEDYLVPADGIYSWEFSDQAVAALWITVKGTLVAANQCIDDYLSCLLGVDVTMGGFSVVHYTDGIKACLMNCKLKQHWPYAKAGNQAIDSLFSITFPILFGAPYLNENMALPASLSNRKILTLNVDIANAAVDHITLDIAEVILPGATPAGAIKQEQVMVVDAVTGDRDIWLQRNWDLLKLLLYAPTIPVVEPWTQTIDRAGLEIDDNPFGYRWVPWEILHGELMDELEGAGPVEDHTHLESAAGSTGMPRDLYHWIENYAEMDFFHEKDLKWRAPIAGSSSAKLKYHCGHIDTWYFVTACYVPSSKL